MADSLQSFEAHIKNICGVQVAVRCSKDVEEICQKNFLSFCEMLRPFSQLAAETQLHDTQGHLYPIRDLRIRFREPRTHVTSPSMVEQLLSETIHWSERGGINAKPSGPVIQTGSDVTPATTPWFDHFCESYHDNVQVMEHEYIKHFVAAILVVSSRQTRPIEAFQNLYKIQKEAEKQRTYPYWFPSPHLYYYHILVHDVVDGDRKHAQESFDQLKATYGAGSCYFLPINSLSPSSFPDATIPEPWSGFLRIPSSPTLSGQDETDFGLKRFRRSKSATPSPLPSPSPSQTPPQLRVSSNNHTPTNPTKSLGTPVEVREEARLILEDEDNESLNEGPEQSNSSTSVMSAQIELGNDPLTQLKITEELVVDTNIESKGVRQVRVGQCLGLEDQNNLRSFVRDFSGRLLPHLEAILKKLYDLLQSKRTVTRRMSDFSRGVWWKMVGGGSGGGSTTSGGSGSKNIEELSDSVQRLMRLVGDLAYLLQNYELSYNMHHTLKRDLQGKDLWIHYAGALEMAALSAQMNSQTRKEVQSYLEEASNIYQNTLMLSPLSLRCSLFLCDVLKVRKRYRDLTQQFIKMINEESDLKSALFLEQAAHSFLRISPTPMTRKYAFHLILAGHHFSKAGQKYHAVRVYRQSLSVYREKGWTIAEDYTNYSCGRLCFSLHSPEEAHNAIECLLSHESHQSIQQQLSNVRDFIFVKRILLAQSDPSLRKQIPLTSSHSSFTSHHNLSNIPRLPLPFIKSQLITTTFDNGVQDTSTWLQSHLENDLLLDNKNISQPLSKIDGSMFNFPDSISSNSPISIKDSNKNLIIGVSPYDPAMWRLGERGWYRLEQLCWNGCTETEHQTAVLYMDKDTDNTRIPLCPVKEPIKVGVVLKNPLAIPLVMRKIVLIWHFTPLSNQESSDDAVVCKIVESYVLPGRSQEKLNLWITPVKTGSLTITGLAYNLCVMDGEHDSFTLPLFNDILKQDEFYDSGDSLVTQGFQGRIDFRCQGQRRNETKTDRIGVVYGEDNRLCWRVIDPMPRAIMILQGFYQPLLAGEIISLMIKIINCSSEPITNLKLSTSLQHCTLLKQTSSPMDSGVFSTSDDTQELAFSVPLPSLCPVCLSLPLSTPSILPSQFVQYQLLVHVPQSKAVEIPCNMVLYYEPEWLSKEVPRTPNDCMNHRVLRHSETLTVQQCLHCNVSVTHSVVPRLENSLETNDLDHSKLLISVDIENKSGALGLPIDVKIMQISSVSYSWRIEAVTQRKGLCLSPGENGIVYLRGTRGVPNYTMDHLVFSDVPLTDKRIRSSEFPAKDLFFASETSRQLGLQTTNVTENIGIGFQEKTSVCENKIGLVIFWETISPDHKSGRSRFGQNCITINLPQTSTILTFPHPSSATPSSPCLTPSSPYDLVRHTLLYPATVSHDFSAANQYCVVPVGVVLSNSTSEEVNVLVELLSTSEVAIGIRSLEPSFHWSGPCRRNLVLSPLSEQTVSVNATFSSPGVYCLNSLRVKASRKGTETHTGSNMNCQRWQVTSYLIVNDVGVVKCS